VANQLFLRDDFKTAWAGQDPFACVEKLTGKIYRQVANRKTLRFELNDKSYFVKIHHGIGLIETIKSFLLGNVPVWGAEEELLAIKKLQKIGVDTMTPTAFGVKGFLPWQQDSFLITEELINTISLEELCASWKVEPPTFAFKKVLIKKVAMMSRLLHSNGLNHRDFYICHFLLALSSVHAASAEGISLYLIDLHRVQQRHQTPQRWVVKDIGSLYFSTMDVPFTKRDYYRFIKHYTQQPLKQALSDTAFWKAVSGRANQLYRK
jgi:heptose I phosphotransferase